MRDYGAAAKYHDLIYKHGFRDVNDSQQILSVIRRSISEFMHQHDNVAIYCNGYHTGMLMTDFIFELKNVRFIIDNNSAGDKKEGFVVIPASEIETNHIDGVIISSYDYMDSIVDSMKLDHPGISYLNIYQKIREAGIDMQSAYYENAHPYQYYKRINSLQRAISEGKEDRDNLYHDLIGEYIRIKDFGSALIKSREWGNDELSDDIGELYQAELDMARQISSSNVLMLCIDGLMRADLSEEMMPGMYDLLKNGKLFTNAYSFSTSTYESLIPVYSENPDGQKKHSDDNTIPEGGCRFVEESKRQDRKLYFYTDVSDFVDDPVINRSNIFQTATEKLWNLITDASVCDKGLFYVHILYESHYSFPNPYTDHEILAEGTALLFDFLDIKGGKPRIDYIGQHNDAVRYLDDVVTPILKALNCPAVIYADHGTTLLPQGTDLQDVSPQYLTCHEDLIRIPLAIINSKSTKGEDDRLISLMELNNIIISLISDRPYINPGISPIRIGRTQIYNPDFHHIYKRMGEEYRLQAFDGFVFDSGEKLVVYSDGRKELYSTTDDSVISDDERMVELYDQMISKLKTGRFK